MTNTAVTNLILNTIADWSFNAFLVISTGIGVSIGYLIYKFGWRLINDKSLIIGGFYLRNTPYKGYNRFRSRKWNIKNTM